MLCRFLLPFFAPFSKLSHIVWSTSAIGTSLSFWCITRTFCSLSIIERKTKNVEIYHIGSEMEKVTYCFIALGSSRDYIIRILLLLLVKCDAFGYCLQEWLLAADRRGNCVLSGSTFSFIIIMNNTFQRSTTKLISCLLLLAFLINDLTLTVMCFSSSFYLHSEL